MKRYVSLVMYLLCFIILQKSPVSAMQEPDFCCKRACWISYLDFEQYLQDLDQKAFESEISRMYDVILSQGLNTVIVQVRAFGDAIYPSEIFPTASYISSARTPLSYDALAIMIHIAHEKGLYFEAWINPYRLSKDDQTTQCYKETIFYNKNDDLILEYMNSSNETALSLDPANNMARQIIVDGVEEILEKYDVDAIHFDDYFYMEHMADNLTKEQKMQNVNILIRMVHECTKAHDVPFGISPAGNVDYAKSIGADIETWLRDLGYVDYIMPQLYWSDNYIMNEERVPLYSNRCKQWMELNVLDLPIYTGLGLYRVEKNDATDLGWSMQDTNLKEQFEIANAYGYDGYCLFRYAWLEKSCANKELSNLKQYIDEHYNLLEDDKKSDSLSEFKIVPENYSYDAATQTICATGEILIRIYKTDGTTFLLKRPCESFYIEEKNIKDIQITYLNASNENCMAFYRTKRSDGVWNRWVFDGNFTNFEQYCTIVELEIMRIPRKHVKNTCFFVN